MACVFSLSQSVQTLWAQSKTKFNAYIQTGSVLKNYAHILEILLRLRQACNHPHLVLHARRNGTSDDAVGLLQKYIGKHILSLKTLFFKKF